MVPRWEQDGALPPSCAEAVGVKQRRGMDGARTLMHGPEWIPRGASKAHPRDGLRARRPVQPNAPTKRTPPIKARMFWISLTDKFQKLCRHRGGRGAWAAGIASPATLNWRSHAYPDDPH
jgi:hypothetical protein